MSGENRVIRGTYSNLRFVRSRKVAEIIVEIPIEAADNALKMLGSPKPSSEQWVAIALMNPSAAQIQPVNEVGENIVEISANICRDDDFRKFLARWTGQDMDFDTGSTETAGMILRRLLGIECRTELLTNAEAREAFENLVAEFHRTKTNKSVDN